ncbi:hypothetical protein FHU33_4947 [Blastococcus colisei]|uniref:Uncharacterized protein n=1 Tax=Blastococcus colisei TaxID=1564162 RepID=A0A543NV70_9ACTN|nr:hypothetical protein [Blastococcus colisei]TQN35718.1 hypothetical protein FHU33_4947 [Blastococcus colisei]
MTEVPGTDRDRARENVVEETPLVPESVEDADDSDRAGDEGTTGDEAKPKPGSTEPLS